jgi:DNA-directed RNA polymerase subunit beta'
VGRLILSGSGLAFHCARKEREVWQAEERHSLLQQEKANVAAELQAMEDQQVALASAEQHDDGKKSP